MIVDDRVVVVGNHPHADDVGVVRSVKSNGYANVEIKGYGLRGWRIVEIALGNLHLDEGVDAI